MYHAIISGTGSALGAQKVTNEDLSHKLDTSDAWIQERTGIQSRYLAQEGQTTASLAYDAACKALEDAAVAATDVDLIVVATATPDMHFPSVATQVQGMLDIKKCTALDVSAACSGFLYALDTAFNKIQLGQAKKALVIGAEVLSRIVNWEDRATAVLFADGAGAVLLEATEETQGVIGVDIYSDGSFGDLLKTVGGPGSSGQQGLIEMQGREVFKQAVSKLAEVVDFSLEKYNFKAEDIDFLVPHQANKRIIDATAKKLKLDASKVVLTVSEHANTSAASVPLALDTANKEGKFKKGDLLLLEAFGAGFTWGSSLIRWQK